MEKMSEEKKGSLFGKSGHFFVKNFGKAVYFTEHSFSKMLEITRIRKNPQVKKDEPAKEKQAEAKSGGFFFRINKDKSVNDVKRTEDRIQELRKALRARIHT